MLDGRLGLSVQLQDGFGSAWYSNEESDNSSDSIPIGAAALSALVLFFQSLIYAWRSLYSKSTRVTLGASATNAASAYSGRLGIMPFRIARFLAVLVLFNLSLFGTRTSQRKWENALFGTYLYSVVLATLPLIPWFEKYSSILTRHCNLVLLVSFGTYVYRDIWPFATYTEIPLDGAEGAILWLKIAILAFVAVLIPLLVPRRYVPLDPNHPMEVPNPEQTASILSLMVYRFLDPILYKAHSVTHLTPDMIPPLSDTDQSTALTERAFPHLDPFRGANKGRHLFWGFTRVFFKEFIFMAVMMVFQVASSFVSPIAVNRILAALESDGTEQQTIHPWFWVLCLFLGPMGVSVFFHAYLFISSRNLAQAQAILTELIFEHSLRIRMKADAHEEGQPKTDTDTAKPDGAASEPQKKKDNLIGKINTLVTVDIDTVIGAKDFFVVVWQVPLELSLATAFLYIVLGWSALVGILTLIILVPAPGLIGGWISRTAKQKLEKTDARVGVVSEAVGVIRMIKLFGWEGKMRTKIEEKRKEELKLIWKMRMIILLNDIVNFLIPTITMIVTYSSYTIIAKQSLTASKIFSSMAVLDIVRTLLHRTGFFYATMMQGKASLERIGDFLHDTELLDAYSTGSSEEPGILTLSGNENTIGFNNAMFSWSKPETEGTLTPSSRSFRLRTEGRVTFKRGGLNLVVGPTGSGKTSILMALLGEMHFIPSTTESWYHLPRDSGVAYAAQESWVQNTTIKENILFGSEYNEKRYRKVIRQCALERDLELFEAGDQTEVGEKGLTLSGGQKARVTLARAVYSSAEIVLLDDVLAALDVHTAKHIVDQCFRGDILRGRTVILATHNVALTSPIAIHAVAISTGGVASEISDLSKIIAHEKLEEAEHKSEQPGTEIIEQQLDTDSHVPKDVTNTTGKLILAEEIQEGRITWKALSLYLKALGGRAPFLFFGAWMGGITLMHLGNMFALWFLGYWGTQYETNKPEDIPVAHYLYFYSGILLSSLCFYVAAMTIYILGITRASRTIGAQLIDSVLTSTLRWLDETPVSRIIARCTQDIASIDGRLTWDLGDFVEIALCMLVKLSGPVLFSPIVILPACLIMILGVFLGNIYLKAQMSIKREKSNARSPVLAHFGAAIVGLVSIRAYGAQDSFKLESLTRIDHLTRLSRMSDNLNRWIAIRIDFLGATFTASLASYLLLSKRLNAANTGFSLNLSLEFCALILWLVRAYNSFEVEANSLERVQSYLEIDHEPKPTEAGQPPAAWPMSGKLEVDDLSARYSVTGPEVLKNISFTAQSGERIGVVGRTGSGKSTLTLSLLRCIFTEGKVYYDGLAIDKLNLDALRSSITIIPQVPELLSGTLRHNLDPFDQNDDSALNNALRAAGLFALQSSEDEARLTLDSSIASGGSNLSVGQRQIIALARAIVRNSKLLILDEATSAIDHRTDSIIQSTLRNSLGSDVTVLTIAHRLQSIMDADKIMVLEGGRMVEYDTPRALLQNESSSFKALVDGSGDRKYLYSIVKSG